MLVWFLRWIKHVKNPLWRIALSNITRPASDNRNIIMALGLGLSLLTAIALVEGNLSYQIERGLPNRAPSFFVAGIQQDQKPKLEAFLQNREGIEDIRIVPLLRAPLLSINGKPLIFLQGASGGGYRVGFAWRQGLDLCRASAAEQQAHGGRVVGFGL